ncbi:hypothetical protein HMPREF3226_00204 [Prevotella corporis]|uniref:Uncharacterized protein n=1 Tax=Prevotella corporis TaxID=28128 RepID=A0A133QN24_9BACT|nr:hypothetical protein HMPREF3226_00204 [Prevotella corporis]
MYHRFLKYGIAKIRDLFEVNKKIVASSATYRQCVVVIPPKEWTVKGKRQATIVKGKIC